MTVPTSQSAWHGWRLFAVLAVAVLCMTALVLALQAQPVEGLRSAIRATARSSFALFLAAFLASSLATLVPGPGTRALLRERRYLGLAFAFSHAVHALLILAYWKLFPETFWSGRSVAANIPGSIGYLFILLLTLTSFRTPARLLGPRAWKALRLDRHLGAGGHLLPVVLQTHPHGRLVRTGVRHDLLRHRPQAHRQARRALASSRRTAGLTHPPPSTRHRSCKHPTCAPGADPSPCSTAAAAGAPTCPCDCSWPGSSSSPVGKSGTARTGSAISSRLSPSLRPPARRLQLGTVAVGRTARRAVPPARPRYPPDRPGADRRHPGGDRRRTLAGGWSKPGGTGPRLLDHRPRLRQFQAPGDLPGGAAAAAVGGGGKLSLDHWLGRRLGLSR